MRIVETIASVALLCAFVVAASAAEAPGAPAIPATEGLVAAWDFRNADAKVVKDLTGNGHDAMIVKGTPTYVESPTGKAIVLDGSAALSVKEHPDFAGADAVTIDVWVWADELADTYRVIANKGGAAWRIQVAPKNKAYFGMKGQGKRMDMGAGTLAPNTWNRITGVFEKPTAELYVNGKKVGSRKWNFSMHEKGAICIGAYSAKLQHPLKGRIDQLRIYNIARRPQPGDEKPLEPVTAR